MKEEFEFEAECVCGTLIRELAPDVWVDAKGRTNCYPESSNAVDAAAPHEPLDEALDDPLSLGYRTPAEVEDAL